MGQKFIHLTYEKRLVIKDMLNAGISKVDIAHSLGIHHSTIYREIERGSINGKYDSDYAQKQYQKELANKGIQGIISQSPEFAEHLASLILEEKLSLKQIVKKLQGDDRWGHVPKSVNTLYSAIDNGLIPGVTRESLKQTTVTVFNEGQVQIVKWVRDVLDIKDGDKLFFEIVDGKLVFSKEEE